VAKRVDVGAVVVGTCSDDVELSGDDGKNVPSDVGEVAYECCKYARRYTSDIMIGLLEPGITRRAEPT
jgi:hypothetical protein